jgi:hypothetical protein
VERGAEERREGGVSDGCGRGLGGKEGLLRREGGRAVYLYPSRPPHVSPPASRHAAARPDPTVVITDVVITDVVITDVVITDAVITGVVITDVGFSSVLQAARSASSKHPTERCEH